MYNNCSIHKEVNMGMIDFQEHEDNNYYYKFKNEIEKKENGEEYDSGQVKAILCNYRGMIEGLLAEEGVDKIYKKPKKIYSNEELLEPIQHIFSIPISYWLKSKCINEYAKYYININIQNGLQVYKHFLNQLKINFRSLLNINEIKSDIVVYKNQVLITDDKWYKNLKTKHRARLDLYYDSIKDGVVCLEAVEDTEGQITSKKEYKQYLQDIEEDNMA